MTAGRIARIAVGALASAAVTTLASRIVQRANPGGESRWVRSNHRGEPISLAQGPGLAAGLALGSALGAGDGRLACATSLAALGSGTFGLLDDIAGDSSSKGLRGHLGALARGEVTTGALKIIGIGATGLAAAAIVTPRRAATSLGHIGDVAVGAALIAGSANLANLLDLRPGRVLKAGTVTVPAMLASSRTAGVGGAVAGAIVAAAPDDLGERTMAGDCGANALGAVIGTAAVAALPRAVVAGILAGVVGLTLASERVSFSAVIDHNAVLSRLDQLGRRPAQAE